MNKPGWKTTEFWMAVIMAVGAGVTALNGIIPAEIALKIGAFITAIYNIMRTLTKTPDITTIVQK